MFLATGDMHAEKKESWSTFSLKNLMLCFVLKFYAEVRRKDREEY